MSFGQFYNKIDTISTSGQGTVYMCQHIASQDLVAVKEIVVRSEEELTDQQEIEIMKTLHLNAHKNVVHLRDVFQDKNPQLRKYSTLIVMELGKCSLQDLFADYLRQNKTFTEDELLDMVEQIAEGLAHAKQLEVFHKHLNPLNVIVFKEDDSGVTGKQSTRSYKVVDFGCGKNFNKSQPSRGMSFGFGASAKGIPPYFSPEFKSYFEYLEKQNDQQQAAFVKAMIEPDYEKADVWTIAIMALQAALVSRKDEYGQEVRVLGMNDWSDRDQVLQIVQKYVPYEKVRALLQEVLGKKNNQSRPGFSDLMQRARAMRQGRDFAGSGQLPLGSRENVLNVQARVESDNGQVKQLQEEMQRLKDELGKVKRAEVRRATDLESVIEKPIQKVRVVEQLQPQTNLLKQVAQQKPEPKKVENSLTTIQIANHAFLKGHEKSVTSVVFSADGKFLASGSRDCTVKLWSVGLQKELTTVQRHSSAVQSVAFSADWKFLASGSLKTVRLSSTDSGTIGVTMKGHTSYAYSVAFSPDGKFLASGSGIEQTGEIKLWSVEGQKEVATLYGHSGAVRSLAFTADGKFLASGSDDRTVKLWRMDTQTLVATLYGHKSFVNSVAFSPNKKLLASGGGEDQKRGEIKLWNVGTRKELTTLQENCGEVFSVAFSADSKFLASGGFDRTIKVWNVEAQKEMMTLQGHKDMVNSLAFSADGKLLASGSDDCIIKLWKII